MSNPARFQVITVGNSQCFSYRRRDRSRPVIGDRRPPSPLDGIQPDHWLGEYTADLMNLLHVLVLLEPRQASLMEQILGCPLLSGKDLRRYSVREPVMM